MRPFPSFLNTKVPLLIDMFGFRREDRLQSSLPTDGTDLISTHVCWKMLEDLKGSTFLSFVLLRGNSGHLSTAATQMHEWTVSLLDVPSGIASFVHQEPQYVLIQNFDKDHENCATASSIELYHVTLLMPKLSKMAADSWK